LPLISKLEFVLNLLLRGLLAALDSDEREVVSGDLLEAHESSSRSVLQVFSLVIRRQLIPWTGWQPWLVFAIVGLPSAIVLSWIARSFAGWSAVYSWMLINNTDVPLLKNSGFWYGAREAIWVIGKFALLLFCSSWASGRLIAKLFFKARLSLAVLMASTSLLVTIIGIPSHTRSFPHHANDGYFPNGPVFANSFYRDWFPLIVYAIAVLVPLILGIVQTERDAQKSEVLS
jgi:hypothetical protein